jgi:sugar lactone lactonase YvrE
MTYARCVLRDGHLGFSIHTGEKEMRGIKVALGLTIGVLAAVPANAWNRQVPTTMAVLPATVEGIAVGADNNVYAVSTSLLDNGNGELFVIPPGCGPCTNFQTRQITGLPANANLLGLAFTLENTPRLVVAENNSGQVFALNTTGTGNVAATLVMTIPMANRPGYLNAITVENFLAPGVVSNRIYVSDSSNGGIWVRNLSATGTEATPWIMPGKDPNGLLLPPQPLPFPAKLFPNCCGANGIAFSDGGTRMYVANTGWRNIIQIPVTGSPPVAGMPFILATGINGPDGIAVQKTEPGINRIWVAANQSDEIVIIDGAGFNTNPPLTTTPGRVIDKMGDFNGLTGEVGARHPVGLLFPASVAFSNDGETLYVSNPAFTQQNNVVGCPVPPGPSGPPGGTPCNPPFSIDSAWTQVVSPRSTVVKFERIIGFTPPAYP